MKRGSVEMFNKRQEDNYYNYEAVREGVVELAVVKHFVLVWHLLEVCVELFEVVSPLPPPGSSLVHAPSVPVASLQHPWIDPDPQAIAATP